MRVDWHTLENAFKPKNYIEEIATLLPEMYSPIQPNGNGNQGCYLARVTSLGPTLMKIIMNSNLNSKAEIGSKVDAAIQNSAEIKILNEAAPLGYKGDTFKYQITKARIGQGQYRNNLFAIENRCRVTNTTRPDLLTASHIKPWKDSNNEERLDGNNGLLLTPHIDKVFDKGLITFSDDGSLKCASKEIEKIISSWGINPECCIGELNNKQQLYMDYHRQHVFKENKQREM